MASTPCVYLESNVRTYGVFTTPLRAYLLLKHLLHVLNLLPGEFLELRVRVEHLHAGLLLLAHPLVQLAAPLQFGSQLRVSVGRGRLVVRAVFMIPVHGVRLLLALLYLQPPVKLR